MTRFLKISFCCFFSLAMYCDAASSMGTAKMALFQKQLGNGQTSHMVSGEPSESVGDAADYLLDAKK